MNYINLNTHEIADREELDRRSMFEPITDFKPFKELLPEVSNLQVAIKTDELVEDYDGTYFYAYDIVDKFKDIIEDGVVISKAEQEKDYLETLGFKAPEPIRKPVPQIVEMRQARRSLARSGLLSLVDALVKTLDAEMQVEWEFAITVRRDHSIVALAKSSLGLTDEQIDDLFIAASKL